MNIKRINITETKMKVLMYAVVIMIVTFGFYLNAIMRTITNGDASIITEGIFILVLCLLALIISYNFENRSESKYNWIFCSIFLYITFCVGYPLFTYGNEIFSEAGGDFFVSAQTLSFWDNLTKFEGGFYVDAPLRLISWVVVRMLGIRTYAPLIMNNIVIVLIVLMGGFFCSNKFSWIASEQIRFILMLAVFIGITNDWMLNWVTAPYYFSVYFLELYLIDLKKLKKSEFVLLMIPVFFIMTSKMFFVLWIPIAILALIFRFKKGLRFWIYNCLIIATGIIEGVYTVANSSRSLSTGSYSIVFPGLKSFINSAVYSWVQLYISFFGTTHGGYKLNFIVLLSLLALIIVAIYKLVQSHFEDKSAWIYLFTQAFIIGEFCEAIIGQPLLFVPEFIRWGVSYGIEPSWYKYWCDVAALVSMYIVLLWLAKKLNCNEKKYLLIAILLIPVFLTGGEHNLYDYDSYGNWSSYASFLDNDSYCVPTHDGWHVNFNANDTEVELAEPTDTVNWKDSTAYVENGIVSVFVKKVDTSAEYYINFYDADDNLLYSMEQLDTGSKTIASFCMDKPLENVAYISFTDAESNSLKVEKCTLGVYMSGSQE